MSEKRWYLNKTVPLILLIIILAAVLILSGCSSNVPEEDAGTMTEEAEDTAEDTSVGTDTGIIEYKAIDKAGNVFEEHPETGTKFIGFKIPQFEEAKKMCMEASKVIPEVGYVGWDCGISNKGPCLIEGNDYPGHDIYNLPIHRTNGIGVYPDFLKRMERKK